MFLHYVTVALRNLARFRVNSWINIIGLAVGLACCLMILVHVENELSYDRFHEKRDRIYRIGRSENRPDGHQGEWASIGVPPAPLMKNEFPEIDQAVRIFRTKIIIEGNDGLAYEDRFFFTDPDVFEVFSFSLSRGNPRTALIEPFTVVVTEEKARHYFGNTDPIGQKLSLRNGIELTVKGIIDPPAENSHIKYDFLASFESYLRKVPSFRDHWDGPVWTYLLLGKGHRPEQLESKFPEFIRNHRGEEVASWLTYFMQPLTDIHLSQRPMGAEIEPTGNISKIYILSAIAVFILLIGCVNFINLSTAQYADRSREISVRKVLGAERSQLVTQYLGESFVLVIVAVLISVASAEFLMPFFNSTIDANLKLNYVSNPRILLGLLGMIVVVGFVAGSYPALVLSGLNPLSVMRGLSVANRGGVWLRRMLVVFQFAITVILVVGTMVIYSQLDYLRSWDLGYDAEHVVVIPMPRPSMADHNAAIKAELSKSSRVLGITASSDIPGGTDCRGLTARPEGSDRDISLPTVWVDSEFLRILGIDLVDGREFSTSRSTSPNSQLILNQSAVAEFGWESAVDRQVTIYTGDPGSGSESYTARVVGVAKDYHFRYLGYGLQPLVLREGLQHARYLLVRVSSEDIESTLAFMKKTITRFVPDQPFHYFFLDEYIQSLYDNEERFGATVGYGCALALIVACLGLFGLASFVTQQKTKEIGIRKVVGASVPSIIFALSREFAILVCLANVIAWPIAYFILREWLMNYRYRVDIEMLYFIVAWIGTTAIAMLTVGYKSLRAATLSPTETLKYE